MLSPVKVLLWAQWTGGAAEGRSVPEEEEERAELEGKGVASAPCSPPGVSMAAGLLLPALPSHARLSYEPSSRLSQGAQSTQPQAGQQ